MAVKYSIAELKNPLRREEPAKFFAKAQAAGIVTENDIASQIGYASSLTEGDVLNTLRCLIRVLNDNLSQGRIVKLGELGTFQLQVCSTGADTREEFTQANIRRAKFQFRPGYMIREMLNNLKYERVESLPLKGKKKTETQP